MIKPALKISHIFAITILVLMVDRQAWSVVPTLATEPLATTSSSVVVRPNIFFTLDNSGSMGWDYLPDYAGASVSHCKKSVKCDNGMPPFQASAYNGVAYNPEIGYTPPQNYDGTYKTALNKANTGSWSSVPKDGYGIQSSSSINLVTGYPEMVYCNSTYGCKQNGIDTNNPFFVDATGTNNPAAYAFPGSILVSDPLAPPVVGSLTNIYSGTFNGDVVTQQTVFSGTLNNASPASTLLTLTTGSGNVSISGTTVTLTYSGQTPTTPVIATGDNITTSGSNCGTKYKVTGVQLTLAGAGKLTYASPGGGGTSSTTCTATVTHITLPPMVAPGISSNGTTVTVVLAAPTGLVNGDVLTVANATGTCDAGYKVAGVPVTVINATTFTYPAATTLGTASNTSCKITKSVVTSPSSPGLSISGNVVTVKKTGHGLVDGDVIQLANYTTSCGTAFKTSTTPGAVVTWLDANTFTYNSTNPTGTTVLSCKLDKANITSAAPTLQSFSTATLQNGNPYEYVIVPVEFCDSAYLTNCVASSVPTGTFTFPAPVRYCSSTTIAALKPGDAGAQLSGSTVRCQGKYSDVTGLVFKSVRYGLFYRVDIVPTRTTYGNEVLNGTINANGTSITFNNVTVIDRSKRNYSYTSSGTTYVDCAAAPNCTYDEEMTNFANYYAYYQTRMQMMKTSVGKAFNAPSMTGVRALYRLGFVTINVADWTNQFLKMGDIDYPVVVGGQKDKFYTRLYNINPGNSTPLREAVARAGRYFAGKKGLPGDGITDDPMQYSCQQNYLLVTTDGYWNGTTTDVVDLNGSQLGNYDNVNSGLTARSLGVYDGAISGASTTLADAAEYYYQTDLRTAALGNCNTATTEKLCTSPAPAGADPLNNVPTPTSDTANWQHMTTFSLGLIDGLMLYQPDYAKSASGDFSKIKSGASGCAFSGAGICNWPLPKADTQTALDDLWHAAVNGRGAFFNARDPSSLGAGLAGALSGMQAQTGAASASATSSPNISKTDRAIYSSTYRTQYWDGEVVAQLLDPATANVPPSSLTALPAISSISLSSGKVSVHMNAHGLLNGDWIQVSNAATGTCDAGFNTGGVSASVAIVDTNNFTYTSLNSSGATSNTSCKIDKAGIVWSAQTQLDQKVSLSLQSGTDPEIRSRFIFMLDQSQTQPLNLTDTTIAMNGLKEFRYSKMTAAEQAYFDNKCLSGTTVIMAQCVAGNLTTAQVSAANSAANLIPYLRGQTALELTTPSATYRPRENFLGDIVNAKPNYVRAPVQSYNDSLPNDLTNALSYSAFKVTNQTRSAMLYVASNDGMLHAFDSGGCTGTGASQVCSPGTGNEVWAYAPRMVMPNLYQLADVNYATKHAFFVDGSPESMDIYVDAAQSASSGLPVGWHTIMVGGLNAGGRGYYALDITKPHIPVGLWETCADKDPSGAALCSQGDPDMGYSYGNPVITKRSSDNRWVVLVASGYNNINSGTGKGYLFVLDALSGAILQKIPTNSGSTTAPSGLSKISAWVDNSDTNNKTRFVYGGDLNGDVWRFDLGLPGTDPLVTPSPAAMHFAALKDSLGNPQPVTTRPELGDVSKTSGSIDSLGAVAATGKPVVFIGTGQYTFKNDACVLGEQSIYALEDNLAVATTYFNNPQSSAYNTKIVQQTVDPSTGASSNNTVNWVANGGTHLGWYMNLPNLGERVNIDPFLALGTFFVVTNIPICSGSTSCVNGGVSYLYQFDYANGNAVDGVLRTKLGNSLTVGFEVVRTESGQLKVIAKESDNKQIVDTGKVKGTATTRGVSWRELVQ